MQIKLLQTFVLLIIFGARLVFAHTPHDVIDAIDVGGNTTDGYTVYIVLGHYRIMRSDDMGRSWKQLIRGLNNRYPFTSIAIAPGFKTNHTLFAATDGDGIYKSLDKGNFWFPVNNGLSSLSIGRLAVSPNYRSNQIVFSAGKKGGLFKTQDGGDSWSQVLDKQFCITALELVQETNKLLIFVGNDEGKLFLSDDLGLSWQLIAHIHESGGITSIAASPGFDKDGILLVGTKDKGLFRSLDKGYRFIPSDSGMLDQSVRSIAFSPEYVRDKTIYASCWRQAIFKSIDGGKTWNKFNSGLTTNHQAERNPIFFSPQFRDLKIVETADKPDTILLAGFDGLFESKDGGVKWAQIQTEAAGWIFSLSSSPPIENDFLIAITTHNSGVYLARNSELSWSILNKGLKKPRCGKIEFSPNYKLDNTLFSYIDEGDHFIKLSPENLGWQSVKLRQKRHLNWKTRIFSYLERKGLPKSITTDFLSNKERQQLLKPKGQANPKGLALSPSFSKDQTVYVATRKRGMFKSNNGGKTFLPLGGNAIEAWSIIISPEFATDRTLFASSRIKGIIKSDDGGIHWRSVNTGLSFLSQWKDLSEQTGRERIELGRSEFYNINLAISPHFSSDKTIFAFGGFGIYKSVNAGESWKRTGNDSLDERAQIFSLCISPDFIRDRTLYISVKARGLFKSIDGGNTFIALNDKLLKENHLIRHLAVSPFYPQDHTLLAASEEAIFRSQDNGNTWKKIDRIVRYESNYKQGVIEYRGEWELVKNSQFSSGDAHLGQTKGSKVLFKFFGSGVKWIGSMGHSTGSAKIYIDESPVETIRKLSDIPNDRDTVFVIRDLKKGPHLLTIEVLGPLESKAKANGVLIDAFDVLGSY
jgi:photosystem II stability/assembly factor-like uncharacterized protein